MGGLSLNRKGEPVSSLGQGKPGILKKAFCRAPDFPELFGASLKYGLSLWHYHIQRFASGEMR